jgi:Protein of unknown function (DUF2917)
MRSFFVIGPVRRRSAHCTPLPDIEEEPAMAAAPMTIPHDPSSPAPWQWRLSSRQVQRLRPAPALRWLAVEEGRVWLTRSRQTLEPGEDVWLSAGQRLPLPPGSEWVAEGWPDAKVVVLESPQRA